MSARGHPAVGQVKQLAALAQTLQSRKAQLGPEVRCYLNAVARASRGAKVASNSVTRPSSSSAMSSGCSRSRAGPRNSSTRTDRTRTPQRSPPLPVEVAGGHQLPLAGTASDRKPGVPRRASAVRCVPARPGVRPPRGPWVSLRNLRLKG